MEQVYKQWKDEKNNNKKTKKLGSFERYKSWYHDGSYLLLLEKENCEVFKFPLNNFCYFEIGDSHFKPLSNKRRTSKLQN